ncbi:AAA family ATPase [Streptomyces sp. MBT58]|uniref:ATP-binding protein n=1 Tax=Streptomyces sp. MBT58 TaxID=1488389 RepID=UPI001913D55D|nr:ATP-binding protein [Streptomyces sp. MBT58]MBK5993345.1 AAA family ATPase [Streptomyces sp. MBT58]
MLPLAPPGGALITLIGAPGSGKSTFAARYPSTWRLNLDTYRALATDDEKDQTATPVAAEIQNLLLDARLSRNLRVVVDSTNLHTHIRAGLLARANYWKRPALAVLFDVPLDTALARNAARSRVVDPNVVTDLHHLLPTTEQLAAEGFDAVHLISDLRSTPDTHR